MLSAFPIAVIVVLSFPSITISPSTITTVYSSRSDELNGYGLQLQMGKASLGYHKVIHSYRTPEKLERPGGVVVLLAMADLWEFNYDIWQRKNYRLGIGINKTRNREMGWQVFGKANIGNSMIVQLGLRRIYIGRDAILLTAGFVFNY